MSACATKRKTSIHSCGTPSDKLPGKKVQVDKNQEKAQSEKDSHSKNGVGKTQTNNQVLIP